jgi:hypothetical protein
VAQVPADGRGSPVRGLEEKKSKIVGFRPDEDLNSEPARPEQGTNQLG